MHHVQCNNLTLPPLEMSDLRVGGTSRVCRFMKRSGAFEHLIMVVTRDVGSASPIRRAGQGGDICPRPSARPHHRTAPSICQTAPPNGPVHRFGMLAVAPR